MERVSRKGHGPPFLVILPKVGHEQEAAWHAVCFYAIGWTLSLCSLTFLYCELRHQEVQAGKQQVHSTWRPWGACLKLQPRREATNPRGSWVWVQPLLLGKDQVPSLSQLTAWQINLGLWGHIHTSCISLHGWQICTLHGEVRCLIYS